MYQEGLFSRRRLFFTEEQVYFECNSTCCQETVAYDLYYLEDIAYRPLDLFEGGFNKCSEFRVSLDHHIQTLTTKELTFGKDMIRAIQGIFRAFSTILSPIRYI